ncbi:hypothetical protein MJO28_017493 [Puccinia striiformis f. sp. tritici]|nr:hypothetical protein MJO28_017493 [Puccinia striiformis f. sp. tritici]
MDTDWCIVCDTRIYPSSSEANTISAFEQMAQTRRSCANQSSSSAFCSTSCASKAFREAQVHNTSQMPPQTSNIQHSIPHNASSHRRPRPTPPKHKAFKDQPMLPSPSHNCKSHHTKTNKSKLISQFTFGSYGSSSLSSSDSSS